MDDNKVSWPGYVLVPRDEYDDLICARSGIDMIGSSLGRFGAEDKVVAAVCKQFGYEYKESVDAE